MRRRRAGVSWRHVRDQPRDASSGTNHFHSIESAKISPSDFKRWLCTETISPNWFNPPWNWWKVAQMIKSYPNCKNSPIWFTLSVLFFTKVILPKCSIPTTFGWEISCFQENFCWLAVCVDLKCSAWQASPLGECARGVQAREQVPKIVPLQGSLPEGAANTQDTPARVLTIWYAAQAYFGSACTQRAFLLCRTFKIYYWFCREHLLFSTESNTFKE